MSTVEKLSLRVDRDYASDASRVFVDQYRLYLDSANRISDRRGTANTFLLTANTALVTAYGLVAPKSAAAAEAADTWVLLLPALAGLTLCIAWLALIRSYRALNTAKFAVILEMEEHLPVQLYQLEWKHLQQGQGWGHLPLSKVEQLVPLVFGAIYLGLLVTLV